MVSKRSHRYLFFMTEIYSRLQYLFGENTTVIYSIYLVENTTVICLLLFNIITLQCCVSFTYELGGEQIKIYS